MARQPERGDHRLTVDLGKPVKRLDQTHWTPPSWTIVADEIISDISVWDFPAGNFLWSAQLTSPGTVGPGDTINLLMYGANIPSLAA
jgi:hypothetical protein